MSSEENFDYPTSLELFAAAKITARECANVSAQYLECKKTHDHPDLCLSKAEVTSACYRNM